MLLVNARAVLHRCSEAFLWLSLLVLLHYTACDGNPDSKRLYDDLLSKYNRLIRPVTNRTDKVTAKLGLRLSQLIHVDEKHQVMTTNVWLRQEWYDYRLSWHTHEYGGVDNLYVPSGDIWLPDIVLFNNADGRYQVTVMTKATLHPDGLVIWEPPSVFKSSCTLDVRYFPFDHQSCRMRFGSWTYNGLKVDVVHYEAENTSVKEIGVDLSEFYPNTEWDVLGVPATRNERRCRLTTCPDITYEIQMRRKTLYHTVNLIIPCVSISGLTVLVFYLPSDCGEKITLCISILVTVLFMFVSDIIPPTSLVMPLIGKYLLFVLILVSLSVLMTVYVLNVHYRTPATHVMSPRVRRIFLHVLPRMLLMRRPQFVKDKTPAVASSPCSSLHETRVDAAQRHHVFCVYSDGDSDDNGSYSGYAATSHELKRAMAEVQYIAEQLHRADEDNGIVEDWKYVAMVLDRLFLWIFTIACLTGTCGIIFQAPSLYDTTMPIDQQLSQFLHVLYKS
ncbi:PREDICTED: acetylcholine receptor subunit alpha-like 1 [Priapulus caudatus]|uniref:Acetylcholine receptor subunit alpha-like 1 n=1 Tax=Priapulus caudatus TaxID=37621 RepID=A0ABM1DRZ6_PRICU|nr:PREDICTED: acetylcholine receptor subunit alpha-like 1 [Priapulus caudatus]